MDGELAFWKALSGLGDGLSISDHKHAALEILTGETGSISDLFSILYPTNGELDFWRSRSGLPAASLSDAKYIAINDPPLSNGLWFRAELTAA